MFKPMSQNPMLWTDGYKCCHKDQYPNGINWVHETWTPRLSRIPGVTHVVFFGLQGVLAELTNKFDQYFFKRPCAEVVEEYREAVSDIFIGGNPEFVRNLKTTDIEALHRLGYLPIKIKALKEGSFVPVPKRNNGTGVKDAGVPMFTIENTLPEFAWLVGYLEPQLSSYCWGPMTSATIANNYYRILHKYAELTGDPKKCFMQAGDFSMRGMMAPEAAYRTSAGHLLSFGISSTVSTRGYLKAYYHADDHVVKYSPSTEHSVMCSYGRDEVYAFKHLITEVYPSGNVSIVSDTYDLWRVVDEVLPQLKDIILARKGKVVIRPDSGEPIDIICGDPKASSETIRKGIVQRLYEIFGGTINSKGFIELDPHIGVVYGDSITIDRCEKICQGLYEKGFATTNVSLGIGSYTYQYQTRDTFGFALKATAIEIYCSFRAIYKDPATDKDSFKRSQRGLVVVVKDEDGDYKLIDGLNNETIIQYKDVNLLKDFYEDGEFHYTQTFDEIRARVASESERVYGGKVEEI